MAQTLLWVLFVNGFAVTAYEFIRAQFYSNGGSDYFSIALIAAVTAAFAVLSVLLSRRSRLTWYAAVLLCVSVAVLIGVHLLSTMSEPHWHGSRRDSELVLWALSYVATPLAVVGCLATRSAWKWCRRSESTSAE